MHRGIVTHRHRPPARVALDAKGVGDKEHQTDHFAVYFLARQKSAGKVHVPAELIS